jgi:hypothetical protein
MLHEHWRDYTDEEILEYKRKVCIAHKCKYLKHFNGDEQVNAYCDYLCMTGHIPPRAEVCEHWKDEPPEQPQPGRAFLTKEEHDWIKEQVPNVGRTDHYINHVTKTLI